MTNFATQISNPDIFSAIEVTNFSSQHSTFFIFQNILARLRSLNFRKGGFMKVQLLAIFLTLSAAFGLSACSSDTTSKMVNPYSGYWRMDREKNNGGPLPENQQASSAEDYFQISDNGEVSKITESKIMWVIDSLGEASGHGLRVKYTLLDNGKLKYRIYDRERSGVFYLNPVAAAEFNEQKSTYISRLSALMGNWSMLKHQKLVLEKIVTASNGSLITKLATEIPEVDGDDNFKTYNPKILYYEGGSKIDVNDSLQTEIFTSYYDNKMVFGILLNVAEGRLTGSYYEYSEVQYDGVSDEVSLIQPIADMTRTYYYRIVR